jgi:ectoine hydroxylase-related dioxygenase (phytanoyl-CoA dioxygenase family)
VTDNEVAQFHREGWVALEGLVSPDATSAMLDYLEHHLGIDGTLPLVGNRATRIIEAGFWRDWRFLARDERIEPFRSVCHSPAMGENAYRLIGRKAATRFDIDGVLLKIPEGSKGSSTPTEWHQDFPNASHDRVGQIVIWIALHDIPPERGSLRFLPGTHREGPLGRTLRGGDDLVTQYPELLNRYSISPPLTLRAGDATAHNSLIVHSAPANTTDRPRWAYALNFFPADVCYNGAAFSNTDGLGLEIGKPIDHPNFPIVFQPQ